MTSGGNCPVHSPHWRQYIVAVFAEKGDYYSRPCGRGLSKPATAASEKVEVVAI